MSLLTKAQQRAVAKAWARNFKKRDATLSAETPPPAEGEAKAAPDAKPRGEDGEHES